MKPTASCTSIRPASWPVWIAALLGLILVGVLTWLLMGAHTSADDCARGGPFLPATPVVIAVILAGPALVALWGLLSREALSRTIAAALFTTGLSPFVAFIVYWLWLDGHNCLS